MNAVFTTVTKSHSAVLVDVSSTGARLRGATLPCRGEELLLSVDALRAFGTVRWFEGGECGVAFDKPLTPSDVQTVRQSVAQMAGLPPELKAALDDWTVGRLE